MKPESEGDGSTVPATLKQHLAPLCADLKAMAEEETNELFTNPEMLEYGEFIDFETIDFEMAAHTGALAKLLGDKAPANLIKASASRAASDKAHLDSAHDHLMKMGVGCGAEPDAEKVAKAGLRHTPEMAKNLSKAHDALAKCGADCAKAAPDAAGEKDAASADGEAKPDDAATKAASVELTKALEKNASLEKTIGDAVSTIKLLTDRVEKLEAQPMPRPHERANDPRFIVVDKAADDANAAMEQLAEVAKKDPEAIAKALLKLSFQHPHKNRLIT